MTFSVNPLNFRQFQVVEFHINNIDKLTEQGIRKSLSKFGTLLRDETKSLIINPPKTGKIYRIKGANHQASKTGEAPANQSGKLVKSIGYRTLSIDRLELGSSAKRSKFLELGTVKMGKRPHLIRAINNKQYQIATIIEDQLKQHLL